MIAIGDGSISENGSYPAPDTGTPISAVANIYARALLKFIVGGERSLRFVSNASAKVNPVYRIDAHSAPEISASAVANFVAAWERSAAFAIDTPSDVIAAPSVHALTHFSVSSNAETLFSAALGIPSSVSIQSLAEPDFMAGSSNYVIEAFPDYTVFIYAYNESKKVYSQ